MWALWLRLGCGRDSEQVYSTSSSIALKSAGILEVVRAAVGNSTMSTISMERVCPSDFFAVGFSDGERVNVVVRVVCIAVTASVISSWCNRRVIRRLLLFFVHWLRLALLLLLLSVSTMANCPLFQIRYVES